MEKTVFLISFLLLMLQSCQSPLSIDLSTVNCTESIHTLVPKGSEYSSEDYYLDSDYTAFETYSSNNMPRYNGMRLEGSLAPPGFNHNRNNVKFCFSKQSKDSIVSLIEVKIFTAQQSNQLIDVLKNQLGTPNYTHYKDKKVSDIPNGFLWEKREQNLVYFMIMKDIIDTTKLPNKPLTVYIVNIEDTGIYKKILDSPIFQEYSDFIDKRDKINNKDYTYQQFMKDKTKKASAQH